MVFGNIKYKRDKLVVVLDEKYKKKWLPRLVAWEMTPTCNLNCVHCRASSTMDRPCGELSTEESKKMIDEIGAFSSPVLIMTGGEPLLRTDLCELAVYAKEKGLKPVLATNGTLVDIPTAERLKEAGIMRTSISIDGATAEAHDSFRGQKGAFEGSIRGMRNLRKVGMPLQINTTITKRNIEEIPRIAKLALAEGASALHIFLLVPTGRGKEIEGDEISPKKYEEILNWFYDEQKELEINLKATCAPHYFRIMKQRAKAEGGMPANVQKHSGHHPGHPMQSMTKGCLGGSGFCFVSYKGDAMPCGYLPVSAGNVRVDGFEKVWYEGKIFQDLRDTSLLKGKCGACEYKNICSGCRARAYANDGDYLSEEPFCSYIPKSMA